VAYLLPRDVVNWVRRCGILALLALAVALPARAAQVGEPVGEDGWEFAFVPYAWALALDGDLTVRGNTADVDMSFGDILDDLNIAAMGDIEVRKGRWGFLVSPFYAKLDDKTHETILNQPVSIDATMRMYLMSFEVNYRLGPYALGSTGEGPIPAVTILPYLGGRYSYLDGDVKVRALESRSADGSKDWADPLLGVRTLWDLTPRWNVTVSGDVGGFGVGSDLAWELYGAFGYRLNLCKSLAGNVLAGYGALYQDYDEGSGSDRFEFDATMHGPVIGLSIRY
jgi:hypothetical protein